jgi:ABC-2 type transport system ATP-binding protein
LLTATDLVKRYGRRTAVDGISLSVAPGEIHALLGPNGAGKSTTTAMIAGLVAPDAGTVRLNGLDGVRDRRTFRQRVGLAPQEIALYEPLTALANVRHFGALYGLSGPALAASAEAVLAQVGLTDRANARVETFSGGMKRRLNLACALVHDPELVLLDEPTAGVDPQSRNAIAERVAALAAAGKAVLYTTHYLEEVERLAHRITIVDAGRVLASGTLSQLLEQAAGERTLSVGVDTAPPDPSVWAGVSGLRPLAADGRVLRFAVDDLDRALDAVRAVLGARGTRVVSIASGETSLEDAFLAMTGKALRD